MKDPSWEMTKGIFLIVVGLVGLIALIVFT